MENPQEFQENETVENSQFSLDADSSFQTPVNSKRKIKSQEGDFYERMCNIEERKLEFFLDKRTQKETEADREDVDLLFFKTALKNTSAYKAKVPKPHTTCG
ncbi:hypothetical protein RRG08_040336 [Elysia crispata]|uniref:Uncharacterized protein n=1 Tax=Elysia crispata TaxID=231223 RepID=A0AAE1AU23_9GAST|nr:hypothetical protein RRG08_040336 [Elysia crispata]